MKLSKAYSVAIESMRLEIKKIAFDANMYDRGLADYNLAKNRSKRKKELEDAIQMLQDNK
jgi:hypothetical protein